MEGVPRLVASPPYGAGLRLLECCRLGVQNLDFVANRSVVRAGKGDRDRVSMLPSGIKAALVRHLALARALHDLQHGAAWVELPHALTRKHPTTGRDRGWQWVFPAPRLHVDRETGQRRRHHLHEFVLAGGFTKRASPHTLRHSWTRFVP